MCSQTATALLVPNTKHWVAHGLLGLIEEHIKHIIPNCQSTIQYGTSLAVIWSTKFEGYPNFPDHNTVTLTKLIVSGYIIISFQLKAFNISCIWPEHTKNLRFSARNSEGVWLTCMPQVSGVQRPYRSGPRGRQRSIDATQEITETKKERCRACLGGGDSGGSREKWAKYFCLFGYRGTPKSTVYTGKPY